MNNTDKLIKKLEKEYENFISKIKDTGVDTAINNSYEIVIKQAIIDYISCEEIDNNELQALLKKDNLLNELYNEWMRTDCNIYTTVGEVVEERIEEIANEYAEKKKDKGRER